MTNSYQNQLNYGTQGPLLYEGMRYKKPSAIPYTLTGGVIGGLAGGCYGAYKSTRKDSFISKNGNINKDFIKETYEKYLKTSKNSDKDIYEGSIKILDKIDSVKTSEEIQELFNANKEAATEIFNELKQTPEDFAKNISQNNLAENKKVIKDKINAANNARYQNIKNQIQACWDKDKKEFIKNENVSDDLVKILKKTSNKLNWKTMGKFAVIGSAISAVIGFITAKLLLK